MKKILISTGFILSFALIAISAYFIINPVVKVEKKVVVTKPKVLSAVKFVIIDINPSVELGLDTNNEVVEVTPLNSDADIAYDNLDLVGKSVTEATTTVVEAATDLGYINEATDDNSVSVTAVTEDDADRDTLNSEVVTSLEDHFNKKLLAVLIIKDGMDEELKAKATTYGIPYGKMLLVKRAMLLDTTLVEADLVKLTVKEIQTKIKLKVKERIQLKKQELAAKKQSFQTLKTELRAKLQLAREKKINEVLSEYGDVTKMTEEQKQTHLKEYREKLKAEIATAKTELQAARETSRAKRAALRAKYLTNKTEDQS